MNKETEKEVVKAFHATAEAMTAIREVLVLTEIRLARAEQELQAQKERNDFYSNRLGQLSDRIDELVFRLNREEVEEHSK